MLSRSASSSVAARAISDPLVLPLHQPRPPLRGPEVPAMRWRRSVSTSVLERVAHPAFFLVFGAHLKAGVTEHQKRSRGTPGLFSRFLGAFKSGVTRHRAWKRPCRTVSPAGRVRVLAVVLDSALVESFNRVLLSERSLVFSYPTVHTQQSSVRTACGAQRAPSQNSWARL